MKGNKRPGAGSAMEDRHRGIKGTKGKKTFTSLKSIRRSRKGKGRRRYIGGGKGSENGKISGGTLRTRGDKWSAASGRSSQGEVQNQTRTGGDTIKRVE